MAGLLALCVACAREWTVLVPFASQGRPRFDYERVGVLPLVPLGGERQRKQALEASELLHAELQRRAPFPIWKDLLDPRTVGEMPEGPLSLGDGEVDALLSGRIRFVKEDRSAWERKRETAGSGQGYPVFVRKTVFRLELWVRIRDLQTGTIDLQQHFSQEVLSDDELSLSPAKAFRGLLAGNLKRLVSELGPERIVEKRTLAPWP